MNIILIGNAISLVGAILMVLIGLIKDRKKILYAQCVQFTVLGVGNFILGGVTGAISNAVSVIRNVRCAKTEIGNLEKIIYIVLQIITTALVNDMGIIGWIPALAACLYTAILSTQNPIVIKIVLIIAQMGWVLYDFTINNYVGFTFDIITIITNLIGIYMIYRNRLKLETN